MIGSCEHANKCFRRIRSGNEIVIDYILKMVGSRMSAYQPVASPVINHVVDDFDTGFGLRVTALIIHPQAMMNGEVCRVFEQCAEHLRINTFANQTVLNCNIIAFLDMQIIPAPPLYRYMVENNIVSIVGSKRTGTASHIHTPTQLDIPDNNIIASGHGNTVAIHHNTTLWCCLSGNCNKRRNHQTAFDAYNTTQIKYHCAMRLTNRIAQRTRSAIVQGSNMIYLSTTSTYSIFAKTISSRKSQLPGKQESG